MRCKKGAEGQLALSSFFSFYMDVFFCEKTVGILHKKRGQLFGENDENEKSAYKKPKLRVTIILADCRSLTGCFVVCRERRDSRLK